MKDKILVCAGTFFYLGRIPGPGGTVGSLAIYAGALLLILAGITSLWFNILFGLLFIASFAGSVLVGQKAESLFGKQDPNEVVIDEVAGASLTLLFLPFVYPKTGIVLLFFLFRFFDILKPFGIDKLEEAPKGFGIVLDDVAAGLIPFILIQTSRILV
jgi:phosphatidylglycerophosphatase A